MDQQVKEGLAIFINAFYKLEERRKGLSVIKKRMQEDIDRCLKRVEEVKSTKKRIPLYLPQCELPITLEEDQVKEIAKRGQKRKDKNAASENITEVKILTKSRYRKRASDDDLVEEQPVSKRRGITESKVNQKDTPKKVLRSKSTFSEKRSLLEIIDNVLEEKENNNPLKIDLINSNGAIINTITSNHQVLEGEKPLVDIDKSSKCKGKEKVSPPSSSEMSSTEDSPVKERSKIVKGKKLPVSSSSVVNHTLPVEKKVAPVSRMTRSTEDSPVKERSKIVNEKELPVSSSSVENVAMSSDEAPVPPPRITRSKIAKPKEQPKSNLNDRNHTPPAEEEVAPVSKMTRSTKDSPVKERSKIVNEKELPVSSSSVENVAISSDEAPDPLPRITRSKMAKPKEQPKSNLNDRNHTPPADEEVAPVSRMTRSKMAKPKKDKIDGAERSGEESDGKREFQSCSDSELGKKKVKDIVKMLNEKQAMVLLSPVQITKEQEKENHNVGIMKMLEKKEKITPIMGRRIVKTTPLQVRNGYITPNKKPAPIISSATRNKSVMDDVEKRKKEEEARLKRLKEEEVLRKKQEMLKIKQEELKRKHEEKMLKAAAMREAAEKEKTEVILKQEKEREEREKMTKAEIERKKMEEALKKKMANQTKAAEVESRRLREEAARAAKLKEMEEEQRQHEELRQKQLEENERIMKLRQEDHRAKEISKQKLLYQKEMQKKLKANVVPLKDKDNYSITGDLLADEESDDMEEENSKKEIPSWAKREERLLPSKIQVHYPISLVMDFFCCPSSSPDLTDIFGKMTMKRIRSSSAVWLDSPPLKVFQAVNN